MRPLLLLLAAPFALGAQSAPRSIERDSIAVSAAVDHWVTMTRLVNSDSLAGVFTIDATMLQAGADPIIGRSAIQAFLKPFDGRAVVDSIAGHLASVEIFGDVAYTWGDYFQMTRLLPAPPAPYRGRFVIRWHRDVDGQWRISRVLMQPS